MRADRMRLVTSRNAEETFFRTVDRSLQPALRAGEAPATALGLANMAEFFEQGWFDPEVLEGSGEGE